MTGQRPSARSRAPAYNYRPVRPRRKRDRHPHADLMSDELLSQTDGAVHRLTLNRPARRNALTPTLARAIVEALDQVEEAGQAELVVLRGRGRPLLGRARPPLAPQPGRRARRSPSCSVGWATSRRPCSPWSAARCRCSPSSRARRPGSASISPSPATCGSPSPARPSPPPSPGWDWCPTAAPPSRCRGWSASGRRFGCCWPGETIDAARALAIGLVDEVVGPGELDAEVAAAGHAAHGRRHQQRPRHQAAGAGAGGRARSSRCWRPRARRSSRRSRGRSSAGGSRRLPPARHPRGGGVSPAGAAGTAASSGPICSPGGWRSSPAAGPGSGWASPRVWPRAGATVAIASRKPEHLEPAAAQLRAQRRPGERRRDQRARARGGGAHGGAGGHEHGRLDILVNNAAGNFYAPSATPLAQRLARGGGDRPLRQLLLRPGGPTRHEGPGRRTDRLDLDDAALSRLAAHGARHRGQGGRGRADPHAGARVGAGPHHGQRGGAGPDPDRGREEARSRRPDGARARPVPDGPVRRPARSRSAGGERRTTSDRWSPFSPGRRASGSRARSSWWTAARGSRAGGPERSRCSWDTTAWRSRSSGWSPRSPSARCSSRPSWWTCCGAPFCCWAGSTSASCPDDNPLLDASVLRLSHLAQSGRRAGVGPRGGGGLLLLADAGHYPALAGRGAGGRGGRVALAARLRGARARPAARRERLAQGGAGAVAPLRDQRGARAARAGRRGRSSSARGRSRRHRSGRFGSGWCWRFWSAMYAASLSGRRRRA